MTEHPESSSCDVPDALQPEERRHHRFDKMTFTWDGVTPQVYRLGGGEAPGTGWRDVVRHTLAGAGEPMAFQLRYFQIGQGGYSSLEKHTHVHAVVVLRGSGQVVVGREVFAVTPFDLVFVPSGAPHQFINTGDEPFGFLCPVDAQRDPPQPLSEAELAAVLEEPRVREAARIEEMTGYGIRD